MISTQEMLVRLAAATVLGGLIGAERERVESTVGLRTHSIVALGSATFMLVSMFGFSNAGGPPGVVLYPSRVAAQIVTAVAAPLAPATHADFRYYTFALTWQPGICGTDEGCLADQPTTDLIGLHGLWASLPQTLIDRGVVPQQWWQRGCDYFEHTDAAPPLDGALAQRLERVMPHFTQDLLTHEYDKHVACFRFDPSQFFTTELAMHDAVVASSFGRYLLQREGAQVRHAAVVAAFAAAFATDAAASLQLRCGHDAAGRTVLTQFWITIAADRLSAFPQPGSLIDAPIAQDDCPAAFVLPAWPDSSASSRSEPKPSPGF